MKLQEKVEESCRFIQDVATSAHFYSNNKRKFGSSPCSPNGVLDVSIGSENSNDSWAVGSIASVSSLPEPMSKKTKSHSQNHAIFWYDNPSKFAYFHIYYFKYVVDQRSTFHIYVPIMCMNILLNALPSLVPWKKLIN